MVASMEPSCAHSSLILSFLVLHFELCCYGHAWYMLYRVTFLMENHTGLVNRCFFIKDLKMETIDKFYIEKIIF